MSTMTYMGYASHRECSDEDACFVGRIDVADYLIWYNNSSSGSRSSPLMNRGKLFLQS